MTNQTPNPAELAEQMAQLAEATRVQKELAQQAMASKLASDQLASFGSQAKANLQVLMQASGGTKQRVLAADGTNMGTVSLCGGEAKFEVTNLAEYVAWVAEFHPGELVQIVRESFTKAMLARANEIGEPVDAEGNLIAGIDLVEREPYLMVRPSAAAKVRMADLLGEAEWMRQLPAGSVQPAPAASE